MSDDKIRELKEGYDKLFTNYRENNDNLRQEGRVKRRDLLTTLSKLEKDIGIEEYEKENEKKKKAISVTTVDNSQEIQDLKKLRDRIFNLKDIPVNDKTHFYLKVYTFDNGNESKYYLYKLKDDLYYKRVNIGYDLKENVVKDLTSLYTIIEFPNHNDYDIKNMLEILKGYVEDKNIQPETSITGRVREGVYGLLGSMNPLRATGATGGKRNAHAASAYKSTGDKVLLLIDNKKLHRSIYVKGNGKAKYCKINNEFILLSKLKNKIINI